MNATALLFLNDLSSYGCAVMKTYICEKDDPLFLVMKIIEVKSEGLQLDP